MLPDWRGTVAAIMATVVLIVAAVALVAARMPTPAAFAVSADAARPVPLALPPSPHAGEFERRAALRRSEELRRVLSIRIGPAAAAARAPLPADLATETPAPRTPAFGPHAEGHAQPSWAVVDEQSRAKGRAKLAALHLPQQIAFEISPTQTDASAAPFPMLPRDVASMPLAAMRRPAPIPPAPVAPSEPSRPIASAVHVVAAWEIPAKVALATPPASTSVTDSDPAASGPVIIARDVAEPEYAPPEILAAVEPSHSPDNAASRSTRVPMPPIRRPVSASRRPKPLTTARARKPKKRAAKSSARKQAQKARLPARRKAIAARKKAAARRAATAAKATTTPQQQSLFGTSFGLGWWQEPAQPATRARPGTRQRQGL